MTEQTKELIAYKGFNKDLRCRGYQYEVGKTYEHNGEVEVCEGGFHACENPFDVLDYYDPHNGHRFALVKASGEISHRQNEYDDTKFAARKLKVEAELSIHRLFECGFDWVQAKVLRHLSYLPPSSVSEVVAGDMSIAVARETSLTAAASGYRSTAATFRSQVTATACGRYSTAVTAGDMSIAASSGYRAIAVTSGYRATATTTGDMSISATFCRQATAVTAGDFSTAATSGEMATAATSGYKSMAITAGEMSTAATSGDMSAAVVTGENSVAMAVGDGARAKASAGGAIVCCYFDEGGELIHIRASKVGENGIKPDVYYTLDADGEFCEVRE